MRGNIYILRIAAPFDGANIFQHFGKTQQFKLYDSDGKTITHSEIIGTDGNGHGALAPYLKAHGVVESFAEGSAKECSRHFRIWVSSFSRGSPETLTRPYENY